MRDCMPMVETTSPLHSCSTFSSSESVGSAVLQPPFIPGSSMGRVSVGTVLGPILDFWTLRTGEIYSRQKQSDYDKVNDYPSNCAVGGAEGHNRRPAISPASIEDLEAILLV